jgi:hypothetical protein
MRSHPRRVTYRDAAQADLDRRRALAWRLEVIDRRWMLSRWLPITETWLRVGDFSSRMAGLEAAYEENRP